MKITIDEDEAWPTYYIREHGHGHEVEVHAGTLKRWRRIIGQYAAVQDEMAALYEANPPPSKPPKRQGRPPYSPIGVEVTVVD